MIGVLVIAAGLLFSSCGKQVMAPQTEYVFGTVCSVNLFDDGTEQNYIDVFSRLNEIDNEFNVNKETSDISRVNKNAGIVKTEVKKEVYELVRLSKDIWEATDGAFNPALGALINLWGIGKDNQRVPSEEEILEAKKHCGADAVQLIEENGKYYIEINDPETAIDLGAIVKGFAADELVSMLKKKNVKKGIIDLGGNIYCFGKKSAKDENALWRVGIKNPVDVTSAPVSVVELKSGSVVTSGNYERYFFENGKRYHHIIDGKTGYPAETGIASVTVVFEKSVICDALATACFVSGEDRGFGEKLGLDGIKYFWIAENGETLDK